MNLRQLPIFPTIVVLIAAGIMVWLGIWQLGRAEGKAELIARYEQALAMSSEVQYPFAKDELNRALFRRSSLDCAEVLSVQSRAGTSERGAKGWSHYASCRVADTGETSDVVIGWSRQPQSPAWAGGEVRGMVAPGPRLVAMPPQAGLEQVALPDPSDLPNNHLAYAGQWFFFALTALVIYWLAMKKRLGERREDEA